MKLSALLHEAGIESPCRLIDCEIGEIVTNSKDASFDSLFVCIDGERHDGHDYVEEALLRGASAVVLKKGKNEKLPLIHPYVTVIEVDNTRAAAALLYAAWYGHPQKKLNIIAVTGTNGKTTVTYMLRTIFEAAMYKCGVIGTVMCSSGKRQIFASADDPLANMTTPDPKQLYRLLAFMAADGVEYVFMEASSHALALSKLDAIEFDTAIFTNLTPEHLDFHGDMESYAAAKAKLFRRARLSVINGEDAASERMAEASTGAVYRYFGRGESRRAYFYATDIEMIGARGIKYTLRSKNTIMKAESPIPGRFTVDNTLCAAACALLHGISPITISEALRSLTGVSGRLERVPLCTGAEFSVFIDYAHTPDALKNLLLTAKGFCGEDERLVLLFGCGGDRDRSKRRVMGEIGAALADFVIITSDNSRSEDRNDIIKDIEKGIPPGGCEYTVIPDRREAIEYAVKNARRGDVILLAGKGHEKYEIDRRGKHDFDERSIAVSFAEKYYLHK